MAPMFHAIPLPDQRQDDGYWNAQSPEDTPGSITSYYVPTSSGIDEESQQKAAAATLHEEHFDQAPMVIFRMESGASSPSSKTQGKGRRSSASSRGNAATSEDLIESKRMRRQEQNRSSQRAFRLRKESHIRSLRDKLGELHNSHRNLCQSYSKKCEEVNQLNTYVSELTAEILQLQNSLSQAGGDFFPLEGFGAELEFCDMTPVDNTWRPRWDYDATATTWYPGQ